jgi:hypothetical protein
MTRPHAYWPNPIVVDADGGIPRAVGGVRVEAVREDWLVEDRWWTPKPLRRHYFELVLTDGRDVVVFREPAEEAGPDRSPDEAGSGRWFEQRA